ncbi:hypothetical protein [Mycolicibacterium sp. TY81]|uniref:hypothetical protein n=1 Tax=Mycolicibacterium sp. TY81 TaxID=2759662 RepID=UPI001BB424DE|nr:hypothetical protein [Mycolicibacterium sp. TY81]BCJ83963.1 hypothetical protein MTY81_53360 [Mycolicibacterium sp. TY81]
MGEERVVEVAGVSGVMISRRVAAQIVDVVDVLEELLRRRSSVLPASIRELRQELDYHSRARAEPRVNASARIDSEALPHDSTAVVSVATAAGQLGITQDAVRWHCRRGCFARVAFRKSGRWWIPEDEVNAVAAARQQI